MLSLKRYEGQGICIADDVQVRVLSFDERTGTVRLGIIAPKEVRVHREEKARKREEMSK